MTKDDLLDRIEALIRRAQMTSDPHGRLHLLDLAERLMDLADGAMAGRAEALHPLSSSETLH
jgi:hypothetical protein